MGIEHMIDHTMLKADASKDTIIRYCSEARERDRLALPHAGAPPGHAQRQPLCAAGGGAVKGKRCKDVLCGGIPAGSHAYQRKGF